MSSQACTLSPASEENIGLRHLIAVKKIEIGVIETRLRMQHDRKRRNGEAVAILTRQRTQRGGDDIGATSDGLGEDDVRLEFEEAIGRVNQIGKATAEAAAGNLIAVDAHGRGVMCVHQIATLIVQDDGGSQSPLL